MQQLSPHGHPLRHNYSTAINTGTSKFIAAIFENKFLTKFIFL